MLSTIRIQNRNFKSLEGKLPKKYAEEKNKQNTKNMNVLKILDNNSCLPQIQNGKQSQVKNSSNVNEKLPQIKRSESEYKKGKIKEQVGFVNKRDYLRKMR